MSNLADTAAPQKPRKFALRSIAAALCLIIGALLLPLGVVGFWGQRTLTDSQRFIDTLGPLIEDQQFQQDLSTVVADQVVTKIDLTALAKTYLPPAAQALVGPVEGMIEQFVYNITLKFVGSDEFQKVFLGVASDLQTAVVKALSGDDSGAVMLQNGEVVLDLSKVAQAVEQKLEARGITILEGKQLPPSAQHKQFVLLNSNQVVEARIAYAVSVPIARYLIFISILLFVGAIALSRRRWRMTGVVGAIAIFWGLVIVAALSFTAGIVNQSAQSTPFARSAEVFYQILLTYLNRAAWIVFWIGLLMVVVAWIFSNQKYSVALKSKLSNTDHSGSEPTAVPPA